MNPSLNTVTLNLTKEEQALLEKLVQEGDFNSPAEALRSLLHDAVAIYDTLWDKTFANSQDLLERLADEAHEDYLAGETEDFDPDEAF